MLAKDGFDPDYGARPVRRLIQERLEDEIAEHILKGIFKPGDIIKVVKKGSEGFDFVHGTKAKSAPVEVDAEAVEV